MLWFAVDLQCGQLLKFKGEGYTLEYIYQHLLFYHLKNDTTLELNEEQKLNMKNQDDDDGNKL